MIGEVGWIRRHSRSVLALTPLAESQPAQPYPVIGGHLLFCAAGFAALWSLGPGEMTSAGAVGLAALLMLIARATHPPAGIDAFLVAGLGLPTSWFVNPVLIGALLLVIYSRLRVLGEHRLTQRPSSR
jgi:CBS domain-containing membrane protein